MAPWSLMIVAILIAGIKKRMTSTNIEKFFLVVILSTFVTLSLFSSKLAVYMLPIFPFLIYLSLLWLKRQGSTTLFAFGVGIPAFLFVIAFPAALILKNNLHIGSLGTSPPFWISAIFLSLSAIISLTQLYRLQINRAIRSMCIGFMISLFTLSFATPKINSLIGMAQLCDQAKKIEHPKGGINYYYCDMNRAESLDVYLRLKPENIKIADLYQMNTIRTPAILFTREKAIARNDSLKQFIKGKKRVQTGKNLFIVIE